MTSGPGFPEGGGGVGVGVVLEPLFSRPILAKSPGQAPVPPERMLIRWRQRF